MLGGTEKHLARSGARGGQGRAQTRVFKVVPRKIKAGRGKDLALASLNNSTGLWAVGVASRCLALAPGQFRADRYCSAWDLAWVLAWGLSPGLAACTGKTGPRQDDVR